MEKIFSEILSMSVDSAWLICAVIIVRALMQKSPMYFRKILWGLVGLRLVVPFSFESAFSLVPDKATQSVDRVANQVVTQVDIEQGVSFLDVVPALWMLIGLCFLIYGLVSYIRLKLKIIDSTLLKDNIYQSEKIQSPFVCGFIKPKIYLPYGLDDATLNCVLQHERTHIKFADHVIKALSYIVLCVHWFNPLVWVAHFLLCKDIELSCDESVIKKYSNSQCKEYARALLDLGVSRVKLSACPIAFGEVSIKKRIKSVITYKKASRFLVIASLLACIGVSVCFMTEPEAPLKANVEKVEFQQETTTTSSEKTTEPATEEAPEPTTEAVTEPETEKTISQVTQKSVVNNYKETVEHTEKVYDDSMFENEDDGIDEDPLNRINVMAPDLVDVPDTTSAYEGASYNNSGVIGTKPSYTPDLPAVTLFPENNSPTHNYGNTNYPHFEGNQWVYN